MRYLMILSFVFLQFISVTNVAANQNAFETDKDTTYWKKSFSQGLNAMQSAIINPRIGSGVNIINIGGDIGLSAVYDSGDLFWFNAANWQFGVQKIGAGTLPGGGRIPFTKSMDLLSINSTLGHRFKSGSNFYYGGYVSFLSQGVPTYQGNLLADNTPNKSGVLFSKFLSPARIEVAPAVAYLAKNKKVTILYSPLAFKSIIVLDDSIAALGVHGNQIEIVNNQIVSYGNSDDQLGSLLRGYYRDAFLKGKINLNTDLTLYSNYLNHPERVDVEWNMDIGIMLFKKVQIALKTSLFYDYDVQVQKSDYNLPANQWELGRGISFTEQILLRYKLNF